MATTQTLPLTCNASNRLGDLYHIQPHLREYRCSMGSVGSLIERPEVSPEHLKTSKSGPQGAFRQPDGLLKKGFTQKELFQYLNINKKESKSSKKVISGISSFKREHGSEEGENIYTKVYHKDGKELDLSKNSLPVGGKFEKSRFRPSAFKPVTPKNFSSMQNLYPSKVEELENGLPNGFHVSYAKVSQTTAAAATSTSSSSPARNGPVRPPPPRTLTEDEENMSDSGHNSLNSLPPYKPPFKAHLTQISASMGHINHIGSLDRSSVGSRSGVSTATDMSCRSMATLNRLHCYGGEAPPPYELSPSLEDVVRDLEDRLQEKDSELKQMRRNLDESEDAIAQVFEGKQRMWEKEMEELKKLYSSKLRQISQQAQRSHRSLQLQLYKVQQEKRRLQESLTDSQQECERLKSHRCCSPSLTSTSATTEQQAQESNSLEETKWEVCQKSGEISLLKQQLRDAQAEMAQKLGEIFNLKTQLRESRGELRGKETQIGLLQETLQLELKRRQQQDCKAAEEGTDKVDHGSQQEQQGSTEERLRAELMLERRQNEAQAAIFESERHTWQEEKEKVIRYQKELQASYLEMYHRNQALEKELQEARGGSGGGGSGRSSTVEDGDKPLSSLPWIERIESSEI
ncbi:NEDD4-binding protein 3-A [Erpetoichthys calabaricus]|uniref:NEDD4 binding protein 3 n=1 Tax=Erpetoichthys calabaricus TaxID=27687 RepID=A0A8C4SAF1_ERPCA|nr:NEDD4-binding protein 3-A [Erpetoichthys calabaricus]